MGKCSTWGTRGLGMSSLAAANQFLINTPTGERHILVVGAQEIETRLGGKIVRVAQVEQAIQQLRERVEARRKTLGAGVYS